MMKLSTKGRYGVRAALYLAEHYDRDIVALKEISREEEISDTYLEQIMTKLVSGGVVASVRGQKGGFRLMKPPKDVRLSEIITLLEGTLAPVHCVGSDRFCKKKERCATVEVWEQVHAAVMGVVDAITLSDLVKIKKRKSLNVTGAMYSI